MTFCTAEQTTCAAANKQYDSVDACKTKCALWTKGVAGATSGNTFACRTYHQGAAGGDPLTHCPHTADGAGAGVAPCN
jgi:hypothetical protein